MADLKYYDVILRPVITEKSMNMMADKKYTFYVHPEATKTQVKDAVEKLFAGTKVASVNTMNIDGKLRRRGMTQGKTAKSKGNRIPDRRQRGHRDLRRAVKHLPLYGDFRRRDNEIRRTVYNGHQKV